MKGQGIKILEILLAGAAAGLFAVLIWLLWKYVPLAAVRYSLLAVCGGIFLTAGAWIVFYRFKISRFADSLCETLDNAIEGCKPENFHPYEDSLTSRVQGKMMQYYQVMYEGRIQSRQDKETLQRLVSDISHQVKTPIANMKLYTGILQKPKLSEEQKKMFLSTMEMQVNKLDFLMQSLIKMSRLETGTFEMKIVNARISDTIAQAMSTVWGKAEKKKIRLSTECDFNITVQHDPKWTAEAIGNILDNGVKYTPEGGEISVVVRPWQFYTRIDITDTGMGIAQEEYHLVFQRFYRTASAAALEGVGLGLYLANGIITRQKGYISVKSKVGKGTRFSVYLLS